MQIGIFSKLEKSTNIVLLGFIQNLEQDGMGN